MRNEFCEFVVDDDGMVGHKNSYFAFGWNDY